VPAFAPERQRRLAKAHRELDNHVKARVSSGERLTLLFAQLLERAFSGSLTASWREAHMKELLQEMEQQAKTLAHAEAAP
jgi:F0F1-type ATP synthase alpha subunit